MAYCPNCGDEIAIDAPSCPSCEAVFGGRSAWQPLAEPPPDRDFERIAKFRVVSEQRRLARESTLTKSKYKGPPGDLGRATFEQYWLVLAAPALLVAVLVVIGLAIKPCDPSFNPNYSYQCYEEGIAGFFAVWWMALMVLGPIPVLRYQLHRVRRGECFVVTGVVLSVAGSVVSNVVGFISTVIAIVLGQRFNVLNISGDAGFALLGLYALAVLSVCLTVIIAAALLLYARTMGPNSTVETAARKSGVRSSP